jgi:hypothetical protein
LKNVLLALTLLLCSAATVAAIPFKDADLHPLLRVNVSLRVFPFIEPALGGHSDEVKVITRGGALNAVRTQQIGFSQPFDNHFLRGVGSPAAVATLKTKLGENQVGLQTSCLLTPSDEVSGSYEITWYGRGFRRNALVAYYGDAGAGFPSCPPEVQQIITAIDVFEAAVRAEPDSEKLSSD